VIVRSSRAIRALVPLVAAGLTLTACGGGSSPSASPSDSTAVDSSAPTPAPQPTTWPLTGLPAPDNASVTNHPVYIAKIDNTGASDPQYGIGEADLVTQELVEGGITRLAVFFYSQLPDKAGPIRSMRLTDIGVAKPLNAQLVTSGAAPVTLAGLKQAHVTYIDMNNPNVRRVSDGTHDTLHSVQADISKLGASAGQKKAARPQDFFDFGTDADYQGTGKATTVNTKIGNAPGSDDEWKYTGGKYVLQDGYMDSTSVYKPDTIITCVVQTTIAPYKDPAGNPVPVSHFEGKGAATIFHDGKVEKGTWTKDGVDGTVHFKAKDGTELKVPAGHTWLALVPAGGQSVSAGSVTWSK
jgi:hypothetical protein